MSHGVGKLLPFIEELEKLKTVTRQNNTLDGDRPENSAEHSWHTAVMALMMEEYLPENTDINRVIKMLLIHDVVEIDAGDIFLYDDKKRVEVREKERKAAVRLFGLLPGSQKQEYLALWLEFEKRQTNEAKIAAVFDSIQPLINHNITSHSNPHKITRSRVIAKKQFIKDVSPELWELAEDLINRAVAKGLYLDE